MLFQYDRQRDCRFSSQADKSQVIATKHPNRLHHMFRIKLSVMSLSRKQIYESLTVLGEHQVLLKDWMIQVQTNFHLPSGCIFKRLLHSVVGLNVQVYYKLCVCVWCWHVYDHMNCDSTQWWGSRFVCFRTQWDAQRWFLSCKLQRPWTHSLQVYQWKIDEPRAQTQLVLTEPVMTPRQHCRHLLDSPRLSSLLLHHIKLPMPTDVISFSFTGKSAQEQHSSKNRSVPHACLHQHVSRSPRAPQNKWTPE